MARKQEQHGVGIGNASILLIFIVLALTVFSVLTLICASNEAEAARKSAAHSTAYYEAERQAYMTYAELSEALSDIFSEDEIPELTAILGAKCNADAFGYTISYETVIDENRKLFAELRYENGSLSVTAWKTMGKDVEYDDSVSIWDGEGLPFEN